MLSAARPGRARSRPQVSSGTDESGFTLVELLVAMAVSMILLTTMGGMLVAFSKAEASTVNNADAAARVRVVFLGLQHDIQSANPLATLGSLGAYNDELKLTIQPANQVITWQYDFNAQTLTRQVGTATPAVELTNVTNGDPANGGAPVFSYFDHCAINLVNEPQATAATVSRDTTFVSIQLSVVNLHAAPYGSTTSVNIMNQPPGPDRCG